MNYGIHKVDIEVADDYMDLNMLEDLTYGTDIRYVLADLNHGVLRIVDLEGNRIEVIDKSEGGAFQLYAALIIKLEQGAKLIAGSPSEIMPDQKDMKAFYKECMKRKIEIIFRNTPYLNTSNFTDLITKDNLDFVMNIISNLIDVSFRKDVFASENENTQFMESMRLSDNVKKRYA